MLAPRRSQFTIGFLMILIAGIAVLMASGMLATVAAVLLAWPLVLWGLSLPAAWWLGCSRSRAGVWLCSAFPWLAMALGFGLLIWPIRPSNPWLRPFADATLVSIFWGILVVPVGGLLLAFAELLLTVERRPPDQGRQVARLVLIPMVSWVGSFLTFAAILVLTPGIRL